MYAQEPILKAVDLVEYVRENVFTEKPINLIMEKLKKNSNTEIDSFLKRMYVKSYEEYTGLFNDDFAKVHATAAQYRKLNEIFGI